MLIEAKQCFAPEQEKMLITRAQDGDRQAFKQLYMHYGAKVYALCLRLVADPDLAEDATQEVFIQVWLKINSFDHKAKFSTWLHTVTANVTISLLRRQKSWLQKVTSIEVAGMTEPAIAEQKDLNGLDKLILRLPERARLVFVLYALQGYRHQEIGTMLNMATGSSKAQYHRARNLLKEWYQNDC